jgi:ADP-heptose:LPS heptosyltransferase
MNLRKSVESILRAQMIIALKIFIRKCIDLQRFIRFYILDSVLLLKHAQINPETMGVIQTGGIGDYILFRNFLSVIKTSSRYNNYQITLCTNETCKALAAAYDAENVTNFIWINPSKLKSRLLYRWRTLSSFRKRRFEIVIYPTYSRDVLIGDSLVRIADAKETIACRGDDVHSPFWQQQLFDRYYTKLVNISSSTVFEFYKNKEFVEYTIGEILKSPKLFLPSQLATTKSERYAVLCSGALLRKKKWPIEQFLQIAEYLFKRYSMHSVLLGDRHDIPTSDVQQEILRRKYIVNKIAHTTLLETARIVENAVIVVTNDTSISHIGIAFHKPVVIVSNGEHYGRFSECPKEIHPAVFYAYPPEIADSRRSFAELVAQYKYGSRLNIRTITADTVQRLIDRALI